MLERFLGQTPPHVLARPPAAALLLLLTLGAFPAPGAGSAEQGWSQAREVAAWQARIRAEGLGWEAGPTAVNAVRRRNHRPIWD